jgi:hypothetical protein
MVFVFKDYSSRGLGLVKLTPELVEANAVCNGRQYVNKTPMLPFLESHGLLMIDPVEARYGHWDY